MISLDRISRNGHALFLAYDQGLEHGPTDFNDESVDPENILKIAASGFYTGLILQKGVAEKYNVWTANNNFVGTDLPASPKLQRGEPVCPPLILKLNGKTKLASDEPMSEQICTVDEAVNLGAAAVGYTIYLGSEFEESMMKEFAQIEREAHEKNLPVIAWMYPRGKSVQNPDSTETIAYAARVGLEIGADIVKVRLPNIINVGEGLTTLPMGRVADPPLREKLQWIVKSAGRTKVVFAGGSKLPELEFLEMAKLIMASGAFGLAVGRNIWQSENPLEISEKLGKIVFGK